MADILAQSSTDCHPIVQLLWRREVAFSGGRRAGPAVDAVDVRLSSAAAAPAWSPTLHHAVLPGRARLTVPCRELTERREQRKQLAPERGRVPGGEPHGLGGQQFAQNRIHEIGRGAGAAVARVREGSRRSTRLALAWSRGFASICLECLGI